MKKKIVSVLMCTMMCVSLFAGCGSKNDRGSDESAETEKTEETQKTEDTQGAEESGDKLDLGLNVESVTVNETKYVLK